MIEYRDTYIDDVVASSCGLIRTLDRRVTRSNGIAYTSKGRVKSIWLDRDGYGHITLSRGNKSVPHKVHRLVASAWIPNPENKPHINHIDGVRNNNHVRNLEWCTLAENNLDAFIRTKHSAKLTEKDVKCIRKLASSLKTSEIMKLYPDVTRSTINKIINLTTWKHV